MRFTAEQKTKYHHDRSLRWAVFIQVASIADRHGVTEPAVRKHILEKCVSAIKNKHYKWILKKSETRKITWKASLNTFKSAIIEDVTKIVEEHTR